MKQWPTTVLKVTFQLCFLDWPNAITATIPAEINLEREPTFFYINWHHHVKCGILIQSYPGSNWEL